MKRVTISCCGTGKGKAGIREMEIPEQVQKELEEMGGFEALAGRVPAADELEEKSRIYQALADPLRLTILYLIRDQPLCVCVINRFVRLSGSKLSYHLNILKESGLIEGEYHGNWIIYSLTDTGRRVLSCTEHAGR
jgi:ArsR family transcriptional regulator